MFSQAQPDHYAVWCWWWNTWWCESIQPSNVNRCNYLIQLQLVGISPHWSIWMHHYRWKCGWESAFFFFFFFFLCCHACETEDVRVSDLAFWTDRILFVMFWLAEAAQMKQDLFCYWCWCNQHQVSLGTGPKWLTLMLCGIALQDYVDDCNRSVL